MINSNLKTIAFFFLLIFTSLVSNAQNTKFQHLMGGSGDERSYGMSQTKDGGYILTGYTTSFGAGGSDIYLIKTDGLGKMLWSKAYGTSADEIGWKVKQTVDSGYIVAGTSSLNKGDGLLFKTNQAGVVQWSITFNSDSAQDAYSVLESRFNGDIYVTGYLKTDSLGTDAYIAKYSSSGNFLWQRRIGAAGNEEGYSMVEDQKGNIAVVGMVMDDTITIGGKNGVPGDVDFFISKFNSSGTNMWTKNFGTSAEDQMWDIELIKNTYVLCGWSNSGPGTTNVLISIIDTVGNLVNNYTYNLGASSKAFNLVVNPDETYSVTGYTTTLSNGRDAFYLNTNKSGAINSLKLFGGTNSDGHWPSEVTRTSDGGYTLFTSSNSFKTTTSNDLYLVRMDQNGDAECNQGTFAATNLGYTLSAGYFSRIRSGHVFNSNTLTTTNITTAFDSTLCCKLQAQVAAASIRVCKGGSARLGKVAIPGYIYKWTQTGGSFTSTEASPLISPKGSESYKLVVSSADGKCKSDSATISVSIRAELTNKNFVRDTFFCTGNTVKITARSGMIDYAWKGKKTDLNGQSITLNTSDTIVLTVTDTTTCEYKDTFSVIRKNLPAFSLGNDTTICDNYKLTLTGPAGMRSYNWNNGQANTRTFTTSEERTHSLSVVDNFGCVFSDSKVLFLNPSSTFSLGKDTTICKGINYTIFGPGFMTNFYWNGISSFSANKTINTPGTYILEANNGFGCKHSDTVVIGQKPDPTFSLGPDGGVCANGGRNLKGPSNMAGYLWHDGSSDSAVDVFVAGKFWLTVTGNNGCIFTDSINLVITKNPTPELGNDTTICEQDSIFLDAGNYTSFKWNNGATTRILKVKAAGLYEVTVSDINGCKGIDDRSIKTKFCVKSVKNVKIPGLKVYPNPATDVLNIEWLVKYNDATLSMYDVHGKKVFFKESAPGLNQYNIDISNFSRGIYYIQVSTGNTMESLKVVLD